jgi:F-type H+-transporting ATPase subunit a
MDDLFPRVVFHVFGIPVRDTVISTLVVTGLILLTALLYRRRRPMAIEMLLEFLSDQIATALGQRARPYLPLLGTLAIFVAVSNIIGEVPFLSAPTSDLNTPVALALVVFFSVHYYGVRANGLWGYLKGLASPVFMLPLEILTQLTRTLSLALRLFGNILSTQLIVAVFFSLLPLFVPLPLQVFGIFTGLLQAYIFTVLAAVYIGAGLQTTGIVSE